MSPLTKEAFMNTILQIDSSIHSEGGQSSRLAAEFVAAMRQQHSGLRVIRRDLARDPAPHLTAERFQAFAAKPEDRTAGQQAVVDYSDTLIGELRDADIVVLGLPMYNFGLPSQLKAWIDHVARAGVTFRYTANGAEGLLRGKKAYVFATRGGRYQGTAADTQTAYLRDFLRFVGISDVEFVYAEGLALGDGPREAALTEAHNAIRALAHPLPLAA